MDFTEMMQLAAREPLPQEILDRINAAEQGAEAALGIRFTAVGPDGVRAEMDVDGRHKQPMGLVHGGMYCVLTEGVASLAALVASEGRPIVGVNNTTDFLRPVSSGTVTAQATAIQQGRRTQLWEVRMEHEGKLVALGRLRTMLAS
ncbi:MULTISPECIES: PaaI family thioesterase [unclassified Corynebacterium]|uniref:PaaI family thioesterase n=1 Tax=unclassified Corynebacterium TaxID=2624378 RepID=UPI0029CA3778|nr:MULTISPECIES: PaaI family thioesterase [unclassified Corynebacterium]WPF67154.1 PaaI family thioesterase [Corynebacterium sp. 22KM0430]WPF69643.1 PaaI family thioesterase [Corynebacterium sp. 21KM1197]